MKIDRKPVILIIGKNGQVGWELCRTMARIGHIIAVDYPEIDLENPDSIRKTIRTVKPDLIINAAAYTAVDKAETEPEKAMAINGVAPGFVAEEAKRGGATFIHYSTDYVFDGEKKTTYLESDAPNPLNEYGRTKIAGDKAIQAVGVPHFIFRTSWVYGWRGQNFLMTMLRLFREREVIKVVNDQIGTPNWSGFIAEVTASIVEKCSDNIMGVFGEKSGVYNLSASGSTSWYDFAKAIRDADPVCETHRVKSLLPVSTCEYGIGVLRPPFSVLDTSKISTVFGVKMPEWKYALEHWKSGEEL